MTEPCNAALVCSGRKGNRPHPPGLPVPVSRCQNQAMVAASRRASATSWSITVAKASRRAR